MPWTNCQRNPTHLFKTLWNTITIIRTVHSTQFAEQYLELTILLFCAIRKPKFYVSNIHNVTLSNYWTTQVWSWCGGRSMESPCTRREFHIPKIYTQGWDWEIVVIPPSPWRPKTTFMLNADLHTEKRSPSIARWARQIPITPTSFESRWTTSPDNFSSNSTLRTFWKMLATLFSKGLHIGWVKISDLMYPSISESRTGSMVNHRWGS